MPALDDIAAQKLALLDEKQLRRTLREPAAMQELVSFSSNDYLGLSAHPKVIKAAESALKTYGLGGTASRLAGGNHAEYGVLEAALAQWKHYTAARVFSSGYAANIGVIPALVGAGDLIIADRLVHACMIDGAKLSGAQMMRFAHNHLDHCREILAAHRGEYAHCLLMTEAVFSMDGDTAPLQALAKLAEEFEAWLLVDSAHALQPLEWEKKPENIIEITTLSKALGALGGAVLGSQLLVDYITNTARSLIFSTGLPPSVVAGANAALQVVQAEPQRAQRALALAQHFANAMQLAPAQSAIVPLQLGEAKKAMEGSEKLAQRGFFVPAIRPPTVPPNTARLRFAFRYDHTDAQVNELIRTLRELGICPCEP